MAVKGAITVGNIHILDVDANPNGSVLAPKGSLASDQTNALFYINTDGAMAWSFLTALADPRDIMRFSMIHNVGVTGGG